MDPTEYDHHLRPVRVTMPTSEISLNHMAKKLRIRLQSQCVILTDENCKKKSLLSFLSVVVVDADGVEAEEEPVRVAVEC